MSRRAHSEEEGAAAGKLKDADANDDNDNDDDNRLAGESSASRGLTRSGRVYRTTNRGYYETRRELVLAHARLFSPEVAFTLLGTQFSLTLALLSQSSPSSLLLFHPRRLEQSAPF
jgi:hypothetical protein